jgi:uncharacterized membrane protein
MIAFLAASICMVIVGLTLPLFIGDPDYTGNQQVWVVATGIFVLIAGYALGCADTAEKADRYQDKKDKKNEIPTV